MSKLNLLLGTAVITLFIAAQAYAGGSCGGCIGPKEEPESVESVGDELVDDVVVTE